MKTMTFKSAMNKPTRADYLREARFQLVGVLMTMKQTPLLYSKLNEAIGTIEEIIVAVAALDEKL